MLISAKLDNLTEEEGLRVYELARRRRITVKAFIKEAIVAKLNEEYARYFPP